MTIRTRWAPSPTGYAHLGFISRILINYAMAKKNNGQFVWRNEDTDQERFVADALEYNMKWVREFGLDWDEGPDKGGPYAPYNQTERVDLYKVAYEKLIENDYAYKCFCTRERLAELREMQQLAKQQTRYDGKCRALSEEEISANLKEGKPFTVRVKMPKDRKIEFDDIITHNHVVWNSNDVDDYIIVKSDGIPTYHLAAIYDDISMKISHVFRGVEWLATTPVHLMVYEGLGIKPEDRPNIGHFTVILDPATPGKKMSKRNNSFKINGLLIQGYISEAILNYLMLLGWAPKDNREFFSLEEYIQVFDLAGMQKSNPTWDQNKMDWFNGSYLRNLSLDQYEEKFKNWITKYLLAATEEEKLNLLSKEEVTEGKLTELLNLAKELLDKDLKNHLSLVQERAVNFWDVIKQIEFFFIKPKNINWDIKQLKKVQESLPQIKEKLLELHKSFPENSDDWTHEAWEEGIRKIGDEFGAKHGDIFMVVRVSIVGSPFSPPLFEALQLLGKEEVVERLKG